MNTEEKDVQKKYDFLAEVYHGYRTKRPQGLFHNEMLEMPATLELLGDVRGKKILDFGCGTGIYAKLLAKKGAKVSGFDISSGMLAIAKAENPTLDLRLGSGYVIPFKEKFDIVLAPLVVHYLEDWDKMFREVSRVLKTGGYFIFSTGNPVTECRKKIKFKGREFRVFGDYFKERKIPSIWHNIRGRDLKMFFYHKTYESIIKTIVKNNFEIVDYKDTFPLEKAKKVFPDKYALCSKMPYFSVWKVKKK